MKKDQSNYIIYGFHAAKAVIESGMRKIHKIYIEEGANKIIIPPSLLGKVVVCRKDIMKKKCPDNKHQGYILEVGDICEMASFERNIDFLLQRSHANIVILDSINDPHNLGAIMRSCYCFEVDLLIFPKKNSPSVNGSVIRSSAGMSEFLRFNQVNNIANAIKTIKDANFSVYGLSSNAKNTNIRSVFKSHKICTIFGSEHFGLSSSIANLCDDLIKIPINLQADSLNVSNAVAVIGYEMKLKAS